MYYCNNILCTRLSRAKRKSVCVCVGGGGGGGGQIGNNSQRSMHSKYIPLTTSKKL